MCIHFIKWTVELIAEKLSWLRNGWSQKSAQPLAELHVLSIGVQHTFIIQWDLILTWSVYFEKTVKVFSGNFLDLGDFSSYMTQQNYISDTGFFNWLVKHSLTFPKNEFWCRKDLRSICCLYRSMLFFRKFAGQITRLHMFFGCTFCMRKLSIWFLLKQSFGLKYVNIMPCFLKFYLNTDNFAISLIAKKGSNKPNIHKIAENMYIKSQSML